jgi:hypothetical protein
VLIDRILVLRKGAVAPNSFRVDWHGYSASGEQLLLMEKETPYRAKKAR